MSPSRRGTSVPSRDRQLAAPAEACDEPGRDRSGKRERAVPARHRGLRCAAADHLEHAARHVVRLEDDALPEAVLRSAPLRKSLRLHEPRQHRVDTDAARSQERSGRARKRELRVLGRRIRPGRRDRHRPRDRDDVDDIRRRRRLERRQKRAEAPHAAEVVRRHGLLDQLRLRGQERPAPADPRVVHEQRDRWMPSQHPLGHPLGGGAVGHVAHLELRVELLRERADPVLTPREQHAPPAAGRERACRRGADAARGSGDDGDSGYLHTRTSRRVVATRPAASRTVAVRWCLPFFSRRTFQFASYRPATPRRFSAMRLFASLNSTERSVLVELATTSKRSVARAHSFGCGKTQVRVGRATTFTLTFWKRVFGMMSLPIVLTFFASWKSEAATVASIGFTAAVSAGAAVGSPKTATPLTRSYADAPTE